MAGNKNSGGYRPNAPQNNPANVSATGGAGQSGNYTGFGYGQNQELNQSRIAGNQAMQSIQANTPKPQGAQVAPRAEGEAGKPNPNKRRKNRPKKKPNQNPNAGDGNKE